MHVFTALYTFPSLDFTLEIDDEKGYKNVKFLFNNVMKATISSGYVEVSYLGNFTQLRELDVANVFFENMSSVKAMVMVLPIGLNLIVVKDKEVEEMFSLAKHITNREY